jgi:26S proteasome regulatory subunit N13
MDNMDPAMLQ